MFFSRSEISKLKISKYVILEFELSLEFDYHYLCLLGFDGYSYMFPCKTMNNNTQQLTMEIFNLENEPKRYRKERKQKKYT